MTDRALPAETASVAGRGRRSLLVLAALFFLPVALAFYLYYGGDWRPPGSSAHGELIEPARPLPEVAGAEALRGKWSLVYVGSGACDEACRRTLFVMRQTRLGLAQEMTRVQRVLLATDTCCDRAFLRREHPGLVPIDASDASFAPLLQQFPADERARAIYVVDPLGNLMMRFDARDNPKGLLTDLKKLLKLSHIG
jgi:hypothetical protein